MSQHYREAAARLRALTLATPGLVEFANQLEAAGDAPDRVGEAASRLSDHDRATAVAFLIEVRHQHIDEGATEAAHSIGELIRILANERWGGLA